MTTKNWRIVFLDRATIGPGVALRAPTFAHQWQDFDRTEGHQIAGRLAQADIVVTNKAPISDATLAGLPDLKLVALAATGANVIDLDACRARGVAVCNVRNYATTAVPELVLAAIFSLRRQLPLYRQRVLNGAWQAAGQFCFFNEQPVLDIAGARLGIIGTGGIARALGQKAAGLGMQVRYHSVSGRTIGDLALVELDHLLDDSDIVSIHCPLNDRTQHLLNVNSIARMRPGSLLINTARGGIVDLAAVDDALQMGHLGGAALDVFDTEPPQPQSLAMTLAKRPNVLVTPHIAWASQQAMQTLADQLVENLNSFVAGHLANRLV